MFVKHGISRGVLVEETRVFVARKTESMGDYVSAVAVPHTVKNIMIPLAVKHWISASLALSDDGERE